MSWEHSTTKFGGMWSFCNGIEKMRPCRIFRAVGPFRTLVASNDKSRNASGAHFCS